MKQNRNVLVWYVTTFLVEAAFVLPVWVIFNTEFLGLNNTQAFLLGVLPYGLSAFFEVPTGSWADKYGRAKVFQLGTLFYLISVASYLVFRDFYMLVAFQLIGAVGIAMQSGGLEALVHDSISGKNKEDIYARVHGNSKAILFASRVVTVLLGGWLYSVNPRAPFVSLCLALAAGLGVSLLLRDVRTETPTELSSFDHIKETFSLMTGVKLIVTMLALVVLYRYISEVLFAMYQPYFQSLGINVKNFGIFYAIISLFSGLGSLWVGRLVKNHSIFKLLLIMMITMVVTLSAMLLRLPWLTYIIIIPSGVAFGFMTTITNTSIQKTISSRHQATALSIASFINTTAFFLAVISVGVTLDHVSVQQANIIYALVAVVFTIPFIINAHKSIKAKVI